MPSGTRPASTTPWSAYQLMRKAFQPHQSGNVGGPLADAGAEGGEQEAGSATHTNPYTWATERHGRQGPARIRRALPIAVHRVPSMPRPSARMMQLLVASVGAASESAADMADVAAAAAGGPAAGVPAGRSRFGAAPVSRNQLQAAMRSSRISSV